MNKGEVYVKQELFCEDWWEIIEIEDNSVKLKNVSKKKMGEEKLISKKLFESYHKVAVRITDDHTNNMKRISDEEK